MNKGCYNCRWCNSKDDTEPFLECQGENWEVMKDMSKHISRDKVNNIILMMIIVAMAFVMVITFTENKNLEAQLSYNPELVIVKGEYTIIHYPDGGWTSPILQRKRLPRI